MNATIPTSLRTQVFPQGAGPGRDRSVVSSSIRCRDERRAHSVRVGRWHPCCSAVDRCLLRPRRRDDLLSPMFPGGVSEDHRTHVVSWWSEVLGGPADYTERLGGYSRMLSHHRNLRITAEQRFRFASTMTRAADDAQLPDDPEFRAAFVGYVEWGTRLALQIAGRCRRRRGCAGPAVGVGSCSAVHPKAIELARRGSTDWRYCESRSWFSHQPNTGGEHGEPSSSDRRSDSRITSCGTQSGKSCLNGAMGTGGRVILSDRRQPLDREPVRSADQCRPGPRRWMSVIFPFTNLVLTTSGDSTRELIASKIAWLDGCARQLPLIRSPATSWATFGNGPRADSRSIPCSMSVLSTTQVCRPCQVASIQIATNWSPAATTVKTCHTSWNENTVGRSVGQRRAKHTAPTR